MGHYFSMDRRQVHSFLSQAALYLLPPFTAFYLMQFVYGAYPWQMPFGVVLANAVCIAGVYFLLCGLIGYPAVCCVLLHILSGLWGAANHFVSIYRGTPILPWDLTALGTAAAVSGSYSYTLTWQMATGILAVAALVWLLRRDLTHGRFRLNCRSAGPRLLVLMTGFLCLFPVVRPSCLGAFGVQTDVWDQSGSYRTGGILATFLRNTEFMKVEQPDDLSPQRLSQIMDQITPSLTVESGTEFPNIVAIMNESWADFEEFGQLSLTQSVTGYIRTLDNAVWGHAYTSVFGAGTSASEFEFLTGNSMAFLPSGSIPYQQYILTDTPSLASLLREKGYRTLAFHPGERSSWQRDRAYPHLGFDQFKCGADMSVPQVMEHGYVSDQSDFDQIIWEFEHKTPGEPLFLFNVTIQNHGSYTVADYPPQVQLSDQPGKFPMAEQYLTLANKTDQAFQRLIEYFSQQEEPTILLMFGDHQPSVEQGFLDLAYGVSQDKMSMKEYMGKFRVPFVFWANYPLEWDGPSETSLNFLSQYLLRYAGLSGNTFDRFLWDFQKSLPALTFVGYQDYSGQAFSHLETNSYTEKIRDYQRLQYIRLFDKKDAVFY